MKVDFLLWEVGNVFSVLADLVDLALSSPLGNSVYFMITEILSL